MHYGEDLPFMMCWANENWTRTWDGADHQILMHQDYNFDDDEKHIIHLISYFKDERYMKVNGKPIFIIYRPRLFPDVKKTIALWREKVKEAGFPDLYIGFAQNTEHSFAPEEKGFDFGFQFQPNFGTPLKGVLYGTSFIGKVIRRIKKKLKKKVANLNYYFHYSEFVLEQIKFGFKKDIFFSSLYRQRAIILHS